MGWQGDTVTRWKITAAYRRVYDEGACGLITNVETGIGSGS